MPIQWSGQSGRMQVGIDIRHDGYDTNTPTINVYVDVWVRVVNWRYQDGQVAHLRGSVSADYAYNLNEPSTATREYVVGTYHIPNQGQNYGGGPGYTFQASIGGAYDGSAPVVTVGWNLPARPANVPTRPGIVVNNIQTNSALVNVIAADGRGAGIVEYAQEVYLNPGGLVQSWSGGTGWATNLTRATRYGARTRARNAVGWGDWNEWAIFTTLPTVATPVRSLALSTVAPPGPSDVSLTWQAPADDGGRALQHYTVETSSTEDFSADTISHDVGANLTAWTVPGLQPGVRYYHRVRAQTEVGPGQWSATLASETLSRNRVKVPGKGWTPVRVWLKVPGVGWRQVRVWKRPPGGSWAQ